MKLYTADRAPNPDRVKYFLSAKGKWDEIDKQEISIIEKQHRQPDYLAISPLGHVPALVLDDGTALTESRAICTYFESVYPDPNLMGRDAKERAVIEMWDRRVELTYLVAMAGWFRHSHPAMAELEVPQVADWAQSCQGKVEKAADFFADRLSNSEFVAGDRFTIADITLHVGFGFGRIVKFKPWESRPALAAWRERIAAVPGMS